MQNFETSRGTEISTIIRGFKMFENLRVPFCLKVLINSCSEMPVRFSYVTCLAARAFKQIDNMRLPGIWNFDLVAEQFAYFKSRKDKFYIGIIAVTVNYVSLFLLSY